MSKNKGKKIVVLMVSRVFPSYHKSKGELTRFEQKIRDKNKIHTIRANYEKWKSLDYLDFNSNIKAGQEAIELLKELRGFAPYCTDHRQRVDDILSKVSVDMEVSQNEA